MNKGYFRHRRAVLVLLLLVALIFPLMQWLEGDSMTPVVYGLVVLAFLVLLGMGVDYIRYASRARMLEEALGNLSDASHALPEAVGPIEVRYHALVDALYERLSAQADDLSRRHAEQLDYYTMWVHQVKTPIAAMRLALQSGASEDVLSTELFRVERYVEMALQQVKIDTLSGDLVIEKQAVAPVVSGCVKKYAPLFIGKRLKVEIGDIALVVPTDTKWLAFIIEQLLSNAIKYTDKGCVRIYEEGGALVVEDTGIGVRKEDIRRIFEKGYTGFNGRVDQRASGLGLYMVRRVATQLGVRVYPESTLGKGTKMTIVFPRQAEDIL